MVTLGSLQITFLERFPMPDPICLVHCHVIHVNRNPYITGGIGNPVIDRLVDNEITGSVVSVLDEIHPRLGDRTEIELHIVVFVVLTPHISLTGIGQFLAAVIHNPVNRSLREGLVQFVQFYDSNLGLGRNVTHLREPYVRFPYPSGNRIRLNSPRNHLTGLAGRKHGT